MLDGVARTGGHSAARTHHERSVDGGALRPVGWDLVSALQRAATADARITVVTGARVTELLQDTAGFTPDRPRGSFAVTGVRLIRTTAAPPLPGGSGGGGGGHPAVTAATAAPAAATAGTSSSARDPPPPPPPAVEEQLLYADAVVLATGGFGADHTATSLLTEYSPQLAGFASTNGAFATGDGIKLARAAGAYLRGMRHVQVHPTGFVDPAEPHSRNKLLAPEALRGLGGLLLNHAGRRFVDELGRRDVVAAAMFRHCLAPGQEERPQGEAGACGAPAPLPVTAFLVLPATVPALWPAFSFYWKSKALFAQVEGADGVAAAIGASREGVEATLRAYAAAAAAGHDPLTGKRVFPEAAAFAAWGDGGAAGGDGSQAFFVATVTPTVHYTMGGAATNAAAELLWADMSEAQLGARVAPDATRLTPDLDAEDWVAAAAAAAAPASGADSPDPAGGRCDGPDAPATTLSALTAEAVSDVPDGGFCRRHAPLLAPAAGGRSSSSAADVSTTAPLPATRLASPTKLLDPARDDVADAGAAAEQLAGCCGLQGPDKCVGVSGARSPPAQ